MWLKNALVLCLLLMSWPVFAQDKPYLQQLIKQARATHLAERTEWLNLLHYKPYVLWPGSRSLADMVRLLQTQAMTLATDTKPVHFLTTCIFSEYEKKHPVASHRVFSGLQQH